MRDKNVSEYEYHPTAAYPWMVHDPAGDTTFHPTEDSAREFANVAIQHYLDDGMWSEDVDQVLVARVVLTAQEVDHKEPAGKIDADGMDENGDHWPPDCEYRCNYRAMPIGGDHDHGK